MLVTSHKTWKVIGFLGIHFSGFERRDILIDIAFNKLNLDSIVADTLENNINSIKVLERIGFKYEKSFSCYTIFHKLSSPE